MKKSNHEVYLNYNALDLFKIVLDIEKYPEYIPWCSKIVVLKKIRNEIDANMMVDYKFFPTQKFTSKVIFDKKKLLITTNYLEGPLKNLNTIWKFKDIKKNKSLLVFNVEYEFKNFFQQKISEIFYPLIENKMIDSFVKRADQILN